MKNICRGVLFAVTLTLILMLGLTFIVNAATLSDDVIKPVVQVIKVLCILLGVAVALKGVTKRGWLYGIAVGILYTIISFCVFAAIDGKFDINITALYDVLFATAIGVISAMLLRMRIKNV